jgi:type I site-specific restriction endonuclease
VFDYPGCPRAYQEFVKAVVAYEKKKAERASGAEKMRLRLRELSPWIEKQRKELVYSFSLAKNLYEQRKVHSVHNANSALQALQFSSSKSQQDLNLGAEFLKVNSPLNKQQVLRLNQMGATVRNSKVFKETLELARQKENSARKWLEDMSREEVQELHEFYKMMVDVAGKVLEQKQRQSLVRSSSP